MFDNTDRDPEDVARSGTERVVHELLRARHGANAIVERPIDDGLTLTYPVPADYTEGIAAARRVAAEAHRLLNEYARKARGQGHSWRELAAALDVSGEYDPAAAAFELIAGEPLRTFDEQTTSWRCDSCGQYVTDRGPYTGHPVDCERGHAEDCARHQREITAYEAQLD
ncbi:hypothetical protein MOQ72_42280 [Saccharopolyspora sp. K220]|uniref:hypothetical protein n=1 Tax=Saccharopolyspora soli TaxID=2926618 RepID=UPI001F58C58D|nr:hypothetical protein [Saccharopolyspora soli]MCI2424046.1 hypothetical protein [Saccharopolyspora soli]